MLGFEPPVLNRLESQKYFLKENHYKNKHGGPLSLSSKRTRGGVWLALIMTNGSIRGAPIRKSGRI